MKGFIVIFIALAFFMVPFWIIENKLNIKFSILEQIGIQLSLMCGLSVAHFAHTISKMEEKQKAERKGK